MPGRQHTPKPLDAAFRDVPWIVLAYLLAMTTIVVSAGRLGGVIGRRQHKMEFLFHRQ
jgi:hypothetical protein